MLHRHLNHSSWTLAAIDDVIARGRLSDWKELGDAAAGQTEIRDRILRVSAPHFVRSLRAAISLLEPLCPKAICLSGRKSFPRQHICNRSYLTPRLSGHGGRNLRQPSSLTRCRPCSDGSSRSIRRGSCPTRSCSRTANRARKKTGIDTWQS